jgi:polar amino acid transport system ATP-binding protein
MSDDAVLAVHDVHKAYGDLPVLSGVSLTLTKGQVMCLIGPSGSGKSTLLRCINHLERADRGVIYVDGDLVGYRWHRGRLHELRESDTARQRAKIGMVFQQFNLFPHLTVLDNVMVAPVKVNGRPAHQVRPLALKLLDGVGLAGKADAYPNQLSGGQAQRVAIARALAMRPRLMLLDEPTSALDPELVGDVLEVMRSVAAQGMTMLVVTHEMGFAREAADVVAVMADGELIESGAPADVLSAPRHERTRTFLKRVNKEAQDGSGPVDATPSPTRVGS